MIVVEAQASTFVKFGKLFQLKIYKNKLTRDLIAVIPQRDYNRPATFNMATEKIGRKLKSVFYVFYYVTWLN